MKASAMEFDITFFTIIVPAVIFAGIAKGGFGTSAGFASAAILALVLTPGQALGLMLPLFMLTDFATLKPYWKKWDWPSAKLLMIGSVPGVIIGMLVYRMTNDDVIRFLIGAMALLFVIWQIARSRGWIKGADRALPDNVGLMAGALSGFTSFVSHAGGPPAAIYMLSLKITKTEYQANSVLVFWVINCLKALGYGYLGIFTFDLLLFDVVLAPFVLLGAWIGVKAHFMIPENVFFGLTYVLLTIAGSKLVYGALT